MSTPIFKRSHVWIAGVIATFSFTLWLSLNAYHWHREGVHFAGHGTHSHSAIGQSALFAYLNRTGIRSTRIDDGEIWSWNQQKPLLVVAEPDQGMLENSIFYSEQPDRPESQDLSTQPILFILPKRRAANSLSHETWVATSTLLDSNDVKKRMQWPGSKAVGLEIDRIRRTTGTVRDAGALQNIFNVDPDVEDPQWMESSVLEPLVSSRDGMMVGVHKNASRMVIVVSDPDIFANHGIGAGDNAELARSIFAFARKPGQHVAFLETVHGYTSSPPILWRLLHEPFDIFVLHGLFVVLLLLWSGLRRFGDPDQVGPEPARGRAYLLNESADLLTSIAAPRRALDQYLHDTIADVSSRLRAKTGGAMDDGRLLDLAETASAVTPTRATLTKAVATLNEINNPDRRDLEVKITSTAASIHRWRLGILHAHGKQGNR